MNIMPEYVVIEDTVDMGGGGMSHNRRVYAFPNGFGASVIWGGPSVYGDEDKPYELAVTTYDDINDQDTFHLTYDTPITDDVIGHQNEEQIRDLLIRIKNLDQRSS